MLAALSTGRMRHQGSVPAVHQYWPVWESNRDPSQPVPKVGVASIVYIGRNDDEALARYRRASELFCHQLTKLWHEHGDHRVDGFADTESALRRGNALVGSAKTVRDLLVAQVEQAPVNYFEATLAFGDLTAEEAAANLTAFAAEVMPAVREAATAPVS